MISSISDQDIEVLIAHHKGEECVPRPRYSLRDLIKCGLLYFYCEDHYVSGSVVPCNEPFTLFEPHECKIKPPHDLPQRQKKDSETKKSDKAPPKSSTEATSTLESTRASADAEPTRSNEETAPSNDATKTGNRIHVRWIVPLNSTVSGSLYSWTGYNLALITRSGELRAYFKRDLLFSDDSVTLPSAIAASAKRIVIGGKTGEIVNFDPVAQSRTASRLHSSAVTSLSFVGDSDALLSSSLDGTVFLGTRRKVSESGVLMASATSFARIASACADKSVVILERGERKIFRRHTSQIMDLSCRETVCVSSSTDGELGIITGNRMTMRNIGCSRHRMAGEGRLLCYGLNSLRMFDLHTERATDIVLSHIPAADIRNDLLVYSSLSSLHFFDLRSGAVQSLKMSSSVSELSFSESGRLLLAISESKPFMLDLRLT